MWAADLNWGDVPTWSAAVGAGIALLFARRASRDTRTLLQREADRDAARVTDARRAQADLVCAWYELARPDDALPMDPMLRWCAAVRNGSALPVYDVRATFLRYDRETATPNLLVRHHLEPLHVVRPGVVRAIAAPPRMLEPSGDRRDFLVEVTFRDAGGRRWHRSATGDLTLQQ